MKLTRRFLWSLTVIAGMFFFSPGCTNGDPEIDITVNSDYSKLIETINSANKSLTDKLSLIETAISRGFADGKQAQELLMRAVTSLSGTLEEKLAAIEAAINSQSASLEMKLGLIEKAVSSGIADTAAQQALIQQAIESLSGTLEQKLAAIEAAVKSQTTGLETKLALLEAALKEGLTDNLSQQELLQQAIGAITGKLSERLEAIAQAMDQQTSSLETKLALVEAAVGEKLLQNKEALALIQKALQSLDGTLAEKLKAISTVITSQTTSLETKLGFIEAAVNEGFVGDVEKQDLLLQAVQSLSGTADEKLAAITSAIQSAGAALFSKLGLIEAAVHDGLVDSQKKQELIEDALKALDGTMQEKLEAIKTAMTNRTDSLSSKLLLVSSALKTGFTNEVTAIGLVKTAVAALQDSTDLIETTLAAIDDALQPDGNTGKALADIISAIQGQSGYAAILSTITNTLRMLSGKIGGHEFVDMGGMFWATCNVGAADPKDIGDYFAWGETETKTDFTDDNYKFGKQQPYSKYNNPDDALQQEDDAASESWGSAWHIPSVEEWKWLQDNTVGAMDTTIIAGTPVVSIVLTSTVPGYETHSIVLPYGQVKDLSTPIVYGYWASVLSHFSQAFAEIAEFKDAYFELNNTIRRSYGCPVRPVATK